MKRFALLCAADIPDTAALCAAHLDMLSPATRRALNLTYRPGRPPSKRFLWAIGQAQREITYFSQHGHRVPVNVLLGDSDAGA